MEQASRPGRGKWFHTAYWIVALALIFVAQWWVQSTSRVEQVPYSEFVARLEAGDVQEVVVRGDYIMGTLKAKGGARELVSVRVDPQLAAVLDKYKVKYGAAVESTFFRDILSWILPSLVFFAIWMFLIRRMADGQGMGGGLLSIGKSKAKVYMEKDVKVTFADVAGVDEAKVELAEVVDFLKHPAEHGRLGARIPKGVLLLGPPGTGKTLLARAVAGEAGVPFFSISGSEFVEMFVGVGAARVRDLFDQARKAAPAIIFIDELDALGRARGSFMLGGHDEKEQTLNQLLAEMDGFDPTSGVVLLAATNRPEILDPALLRAGRFDRQILIDRPDRRGRRDILDVHLRKVRLAEDVKPDELAALTPGFSGADLANLVNEAALLATRRGAEAVARDDFTAAIERIVAGLEKKNRLLNPHERAVIAAHEMGHALVATSLGGVDPVHKVSIIPRGVGALGYTIQRPTEDRYLMSRAELENRMAVLLGGRAAELLIFGDCSTGAQDDLAKATDIARSMVTRFGMDATLGQVSYEEAPSSFLGVPAPVPAQRTFSETTAREIDVAVRKLVADALARATEVLKTARRALDEGSDLLLERETLSGEDIAALTHPSQPRVVA